MASPFKHLFLAQLREFYREKEIMFWTFAFPILLSALLGIAFSSGKTPKVRIGLVAEAGQEAAVQERFEALEGSSAYKTRVAPEGEMERLLRKGKIVLWVRDFDGERRRYVFDTKNPEGAGAHLQLDRMLRGLPTPDKDPQVKPLTVKGSRYIDFLIPGMIAFGVMNTCLWGIGFGLVERRMKKMLRRLVATPMRRPVYLASLAATRLVVSVFEFGVLFGFARYFFAVEVQGSWLAVLMVMLAGNIAFCGIGVVAGSRASTMAAGNGIVNAMTLPMMMLSGVFFSYQNFPEAVIPWIQKLPLTLLADSLRSVFIESAGPAEVALPCLVLTLLGVAAAAFGLRIFKWY